MAVVRVKKNFHIEIPLDLRKKFNLKAGDLLSLEPTGADELRLKLISDPLTKCRGMWTDRSEMRNSAGLVRQLRHEWEERLEGVELD